MDSFKKLIIQEVPITLPRITHYEYARLISERVDIIGRTGNLFISMDDLRIPVEDYDKKIGSDGKDVEEINGKYYIVEDSTDQLAKIEFNHGKCPLLVVRVIKETDTEIYAEVINPNDCIHPLK
jgi:hypothetical protein